MKTLIFYILHGKSFNAQDLFIRQLAASGSELFGLKFYAPWVMRLIKLHSAISYQPSARNHRIFLPDVDIPTEAIYPEPAKQPISLQNAEHQSFMQNFEGVEAISRVYPLAGTTRAPASTEATYSTNAPRPKKHARVLTDRELLVALHQKQHRHHDWLKRQMMSLLVDVNRLRNLATKNAFVTHETCRRTWKGLSMICTAGELEEDGFTERFKFDTTPPRRVVMHNTPSLEDSEFSSSAATVTARIIDEDDDATSPPPASAPQRSAPPNNSIDPAAPGNA